MEYKVLPFHPVITDKEGSEQAAKELQKLIDVNSKDGWKFVSMESIVTRVKPTGCAGFMGNKESAVSVQMVIFNK